MSDGIDFEMLPTPEKKLTDADLQKLTAADVQYWTKSGLWSLDQAAALLRGFIPLEGWEADYKIRSLLLQRHTAPLKAELQRQSPEHLPDHLRPIEWLELGEKCGTVHEPIRKALTGKSTKAQAEPKFDVEAYVPERATDIALRIYRNTKERPTKTDIAKELEKDPKIVGKRGQPFKEGYKSIARLFLWKWEHPDYSNSD